MPISVCRTDGKLERWVPGNYRVGSICFGLLDRIWGHFDGDPYQQDVVHMVMDDGDWCSSTLARKTNVILCR